jgi:hypothetical protein
VGYALVVYNNLLSAKKNTTEAVLEFCGKRKSPSQEGDLGGG